MNISIRQETIAPMTSWLKAARDQGVRDETPCGRSCPCRTTVWSFSATGSRTCRCAASGLRKPWTFSSRLFAVLASYDGFLNAWKEAEAVLKA